MQSQQFQSMLNAVPALSPEQRNILLNALSAKHSLPGVATTIEKSFSKAPKCPHCGSEELYRRGIRNQRQRYRCKTCHKTLNAFSQTPLARLQHPEKWSQYLEGMTHSLTLRAAARQCGVTSKTSFRWRHRFLQVIENSQAPELAGITELDETLLRESFKGQKKCLPIPARKRGTDKKSKCRYVAVMVARDRETHTVDGILAHPTGDELCHHLRGRIHIKAIICADASLAHEKLARKSVFIFKELVTSAGERVIDGIFHLQHVNAYHSHLKQWIAGVFHGVATKYLPHYPGWRRALSEKESLTPSRLANKIIGFLRFQPLTVT